MTTISQTQPVANQATTTPSQAYADHCGVPLDWLTARYQLADHPHQAGITLPYWDSQGNLIATRERFLPWDAKSHRWKSAGTPAKGLLFGLPTLTPQAGGVVIVEGETDTISGQYHTLTTNLRWLGIPGGGFQPDFQSACWQTLSHHLTSHPDQPVMLWPDPDRVGETWLANLTGWILSHRPEARVVMADQDARDYFQPLTYPANIPITTRLAESRSKAVISPHKPPNPFTLSKPPPIPPQAKYTPQDRERVNNLLASQIPTLLEARGARKSNTPHKYHCPQPDHQNGDRTASLHFYPEGNFHCYGCRWSGDAVSLTLDQTTLTFPQLMAEHLPTPTPPATPPASKPADHPADTSQPTIRLVLARDRERPPPPPLLTIPGRDGWKAYPGEINVVVAPTKHGKTTSILDLLFQLARAGQPTGWIGFEGQNSADTLIDQYIDKYPEAGDYFYVLADHIFTLDERGVKDVAEWVETLGIVSLAIEPLSRLNTGDGNNQVSTDKVKQLIQPILTATPQPAIFTQHATPKKQQGVARDWWERLLGSVEWGNLAGSVSFLKWDDTTKTRTLTTPITRMADSDHWPDLVWKYPTDTSSNIPDYQPEGGRLTTPGDGLVVGSDWQYTSHIAEASRLHPATARKLLLVGEQAGKYESQPGGHGKSSREWRLKSA